MTEYRTFLRRGVALTVVALAALAAAGCAADAQSDAVQTPSAACSPAWEPGRTDVDYTFEGAERHVSVFMPEGADPSAAVFALHGSNNNVDLILGVSELEQTADEEGFVLVVPQGSVPGNADGLWAWNVPGVVTTAEVGAPTASADDVSFLADLVDRVKTEGCVDAVFATGYSGGGRMISAIACERPGLFDAIAPVDGLRAGVPMPQSDGSWVPDPATCDPAEGTPVLGFAGTADPINPYDGGGAGYWQYSVPTAVERWAAIDGCGEPRVDSPAAGVSVTTYTECVDGPVVSYVVDGMGHTWPGRALETQAGYASVLGATTDLVDANAIMWDFFSAQLS
ncbi:polyhydroxybutyrate depolymerase [Microbacterium sp. SORGH_AS428]|uniref:alpha/beta hydrolase family esterase n=1 Tax=Microbacterium sp. SORGH_AS_0428 TaxID=3041788 RepID=UPI00285D36AB|nr:PHB depolymerase family esterase [Microbacterium sp. SORGH_AS_0428]MDR6200489.1 polyhydroxybutyrate depolymerase [Microbacterium sp. SORGH_AS_0428]